MLIVVCGACGASQSSNPSADAPGTAGADAPVAAGADAPKGAGTADAKPGSSADGAPASGADAPHDTGIDAPTGGSIDAPVVVVVPDAPAAGSPDAPPDAPVVQESTFHDVMSSLKLGSSADEAQSFAFDLDGDGTPDNALGKAIVSIGPLVGLDVDSTIHDALVNGTIVLLDAVRAEALDTSATAEWQVYIGSPQPNPDLTSGNGMFTVSPSSPTDAIVTGQIAGGTFTGGPNVITIDLALLPGDAPLHLELIAAHIAADVTEAGCTNGRLGGGIPVTEVNEVILPQVADLLNNYVQAHPGTPATGLILLFFDTEPPMGVITTDDLLHSMLAQNLLKPDVDLLGADGQPGHDGVKDSISAALGFSCTKAVFTEPGR